MGKEKNGTTAVLDPGKTLESAESDGKVLVQCHTCGHGTGPDFGEYSIPAENRELAITGQLVCPKCQHRDVELVQLTEKVRERMTVAAIRKQNSDLEQRVKDLEGKLADTNRKWAGNQPAPAGEEGAKSIARGQHASR